jgi:cytoskeletal protein RodZ
MKQFSFKSKKILMSVVVAAACVGAVALVTSQRANASDTDTNSNSSNASSEIVLEVPETISAPPVSSATSDDSAFVPSSGAAASKPLTTISKPTSQPPKPTPPASSALTNKSKKPTYNTKPRAKTSTGTTSKVSKKDSHAGEAYDPVFGWTKSTGGQGTEVDGDWGGGSQVGIMD